MLIPLNEKQKRFIQKKLKEAVLLAGSQVALSRILHITEASLSQLLNNRFLPLSFLASLNFLPSKKEKKNQNHV